VVRLYETDRGALVIRSPTCDFAAQSRHIKKGKIQPKNGLHHSNLEKVQLKHVLHFLPKKTTQLEHVLRFLPKKKLQCGQIELRLLFETRLTKQFYMRISA
jgi:hypothetical protein